jgi:hypothetical protein
MTVLDFINVITAFVTIASVIVKITPSQKDDAILAKVMPFIEILSLAKKNIK